MPKSWKEVLTDKNTYPDDFVVALKDGQTLSLGDMRSYDKEHEGELMQRLTAKEQEIAKREKNVNDASVQLATVIEKTAASAGISVEDFLQGKAPTKRQVADANDLDESDPLVGNLVKQMKTMQATIDAQANEIKSVKTSALGPMLNTYLEDYYETRFEKLSTDLPKGSKVELKDALEYAQKNGYKDQKGRLDLGKAIKDLTYDARVQEAAEKKAAELSKKHDDERVLASAPRPSSLGTKIKTDKSLLNEKGQTKNFDEVLNDALTDTDLWKGVTVQ